MVSFTKVLIYYLENTRPQFVSSYQKAFYFERKLLPEYPKSRVGKSSYFDGGHTFSKTKKRHFIPCPLGARAVHPGPNQILSKEIEDFSKI